MSTKFELYHYSGDNPDEIDNEIVIQERIFGDDFNSKVHYYPKNTICIQTDMSYDVDYYALPDNFNRFVGSRDDFYEFFRTLMPQIEGFRVIGPSGDTFDIVGDKFERHMNSEKYPVHAVKLNIDGTKVVYRDAEFISDDFNILDTMMKKFGEVVGY